MNIISIETGAKNDVYLSAYCTIDELRSIVYALNNQDGIDDTAGAIADEFIRAINICVKQINKQ